MFTLKPWIAISARFLLISGVLLNSFVSGRSLAKSRSDEVKDKSQEQGTNAVYLAGTDDRQGAIRRVPRIRETTVQPIPSGPNTWQVMGRSRR